MRVDEKDRRPAEQRLMGGAVAVSNYRVVDGSLIEDATDGQFRLYWPAAHHELPVTFAQLRRGEASAVLQFAQVYGLLRRDDKPESLRWIWDHAWNVRTCLELAERLRLRGQRRDEALRQYFKTELAHLGFGDDGANGWSGLLPVTHTKASPNGELDGRPAVVAMEIIENVLNPNLQNVARQVIADDNGRLLSNFWFGGLIDVIYWHLADAITGGSLRRCKYCRAVFIANNLERDKYCPRTAGERGESLCSLKARQKRHLRKTRRSQRIATGVGTRGKKTPQVKTSRTRNARHSTGGNSRR